MSRPSPSALSSALSVVLAALLALAATTAEPLVVAAAVGIAQLLVASAPGAPGPRRGSVPGPRFAPTVVAAVVASAVAVRPSLVVGQGDQVAGDIGRVQSGVFAGLLPAVALGLIVALVLQMIRRDPRTHLVRSVSLSVTLVVVAALASGWVSSVTATGGPDVVIICAASVAIGMIAWLVPIDRHLAAGIATVLGGVAGAVAALVLDGLPTPAFGVAVGATTAVLAVAGQVVGRHWAGDRFERPEGWCFAAACSLALAGPMVHLAGQLASAPLL